MNFFIQKNYMFQYKTLLIKLTLMVGILILSGCGEKAESNKYFFEEQENDNSKSIDENKNVLLETEKNQPTVDLKIMDILSIEILNQDTIKVKIDDQDAYKKFIDQLKDYKEYSSLYIDLLGENITIYLDEILSQNNFVYLCISNGGIISIKNAEMFSDDLLRNLELKNIFQIKSSALEKLVALKFITIRLDNRFELTNDFLEILNNTFCENIIVLWDDEEYFLDDNLFEKNALYLNYDDEWRFFRAFYKLNDQNFSYSSYEFYNKEINSEPHIIISIENKEINYYDYFEILQEMLAEISIGYRDGQRICLRDINFDGYNDIIFLGYNDGLELYHHCIGFLWNQSKQQFELEETVPSHFDYIETERKRLIFTSSPSASEDSYRIYEYINGEFEEKRLDVTFDLNEENLKEITWEYYENEMFLEKLILNYSEDGNGYYAFYGRDGNISEGVFPKEQMYSELGKQYFEEFDFYNHG